LVTNNLQSWESLSVDVRERLKKIRLLLLDVDGVLTDGFIHLNDQGSETKSFHVRDGFALVWVRNYGLKTGVISGRRSVATDLRCRDLKMDEIHLGTVHKRPVLDEIIQRTGIDRSMIAFVGDDVLDLPVMDHVGLCAAPSDAHPEVRKRVDILLDQPGGRGAVRNFIDLWLMAAEKYSSAIEDLYLGKF
jgi:3-deoxy-D-manno-octulosonate 8-phosphate phosphatase (KDO 8-P phosphatase)